jgi:hypothetical protein
MKSPSQSPGNERSTPELALHVVNLIDLLALTDFIARLTCIDVICKHKFTNLSRSGNAGNTSSSKLLTAII